MKKPRLIEVAPGELRQVCAVCDTRVKSRVLYCDEHTNHKTNFCGRCGRGTRGTICASCRRAGPLKGIDEPVLLHPSQIRGGKRVLTEHDRPFVEKWWAEGLSTTKIAERLGMSSLTTLGRKRRAGWNLPYRRPDIIERGRAFAREQNEKRLAVH